MTDNQSVWDVLPVGVCILNVAMETIQLNAAMAKQNGWRRYALESSRKVG
jgi:hypothetical protein